MTDPGADWERDMVAALAEIKAARRAHETWPSGPMRAVTQRRADRAVARARALLGHPDHCKPEPEFDLPTCCASRPLLGVYPY